MNPQRQPPSPIEVVPVQPGEPERRDVLPLFLMPLMGADHASLRRVAKALGPEWPVSLVRPQTYWYEISRYPVADAARASAAAIREARPRTPFVVGGFCLGGLVAFETARLLQHEGCAGLVLFDTPVPGYPMLTPRSVRAGALGRYLHVLADDWKLAGGKRRVLRLLVRRAAWYSLLLLRPVLGPVWDRPWFRHIARKTKLTHMPLFWPGALRIPVLHVLADSVRAPQFENARLDWESVARCGVTYASVSGGHDSVFFRPNLPILAAEIQEWTKGLLAARAKAAKLP